MYLPLYEFVVRIKPVIGTKSTKQVLKIEILKWERNSTFIIYVYNTREKTEICMTYSCQTT